MNSHMTEEDEAKYLGVEPALYDEALNTIMASGQGITRDAARQMLAQVLTKPLTADELRKALEP